MPPALDQHLAVALLSGAGSLRVVAHELARLGTFSVERLEDLLFSMVEWFLVPHSDTFVYLPSLIASSAPESMEETWAERTTSPGTDGRELPERGHGDAY